MTRICCGASVIAIGVYDRKEKGTWKFELACTGSIIIIYSIPCKRACATGDDSQRNLESNPRFYDIIKHSTRQIEL